MPSRGRQANFPPGFTQHHEDLIQLYYIVNPEQGLKELFENIILTTGGLAFPQDIRTYSNQRIQSRRRRATLVEKKVFVEAHFYPHFEDSPIINRLLESQSQSVSTTTTLTMARGIADDDSFAGSGRRSSRRSARSAGAEVDEEELIAQFKNVVGVGGSSSSSGRRKSKSRSPVPGRRTGGTAKKSTSFITLDNDDDDIDIIQSIVNLEKRLAFTPSIIPNHFDISLFEGGELLTDDGSNWVEYLSLSIPYPVEEDVADGRTTLALDTSVRYMHPEGLGSRCLLLTRPIYSIAQQQAWAVHTRIAYEEYKEYHRNNDVNVTVAKLDAAREGAINKCGSALAPFIDPETKKPRTVTYRLHLPVRNGEQIYVHTDYFQKRNWNSQPTGSIIFKPFESLDFFEQPKCNYYGHPLPQTMRALVYRMPISETEREHFDHVTTSRDSTPPKARDRMQAAQDAKAEMARESALNRPKHSQAPIQAPIGVTFNTPAFTFNQRTQQGTKRNKRNMSTSSTSSTMPTSNFGNYYNVSTIPPSAAFATTNNNAFAMPPSTYGTYASVPPSSTFGNTTTNNASTMPPSSFGTYNNASMPPSTTTNYNNAFAMPPSTHGTYNNASTMPPSTFGANYTNATPPPSTFSNYNNNASTMPPSTTTNYNNNSSTMPPSTFANYNNNASTMPPSTNYNNNASTMPPSTTTNNNNSNASTMPPSTNYNNNASTMPPSTTTNNNSNASTMPPSTNNNYNSNASTMPPSTNNNYNNNALTMPPSTTTNYNNNASTMPPSTTTNYNNNAATMPPSTFANYNNNASTMPPSTNYNNNASTMPPSTTNNNNASTMPPPTFANYNNNASTMLLSTFPTANNNNASTMPPSTFTTTALTMSPPNKRSNLFNFGMQNNSNFFSPPQRNNNVDDAPNKINDDETDDGMGQLKDDNDYQGQEQVNVPYRRFARGISSMSSIHRGPLDFYHRMRLRRKQRKVVPPSMNNDLGLPEDKEVSTISSSLQQMVPKLLDPPGRRPTSHGTAKLQPSKPRLCQQPTSTSPVKVSPPTSHRHPRTLRVEEEISSQGSSLQQFPKLLDPPVEEPASSLPEKFRWSEPRSHQQHVKSRDELGHPTPNPSSLTLSPPPSLSTQGSLLKLFPKLPDPPLGISTEPPGQLDVSVSMQQQQTHQLICYQPEKSPAYLQSKHHICLVQDPPMQQQKDVLIVSQPKNNQSTIHKQSVLPRRNPDLLQEEGSVYPSTTLHQLHIDLSRGPAQQTAPRLHTCNQYNKFQWQPSPLPQGANDYSSAELILFQAAQQHQATTEAVNPLPNHATTLVHHQSPSLVSQFSAQRDQSACTPPILSDPRQQGDQPNNEQSTIYQQPTYPPPFLHLQHIHHLPLAPAHQPAPELHPNNQHHSMLQHQSPLLLPEAAEHVLDELVLYPATQQQQEITEAFFPLPDSATTVMQLDQPSDELSTIHQQPSCQPPSLYQQHIHLPLEPMQQPVSELHPFNQHHMLQHQSPLLLTEPAEHLTCDLPLHPAKQQKQHEIMQEVDLLSNRATNLEYHQSPSLELQLSNQKDEHSCSPSMLLLQNFSPFDPGQQSPQSMQYQDDMQVDQPNNDLQMKQSMQQPEDMHVNQLHEHSTIHHQSTYPPPTLHQQHIQELLHGPEQQPVPELHANSQPQQQSSSFLLEAAEHSVCERVFLRVMQQQQEIVQEVFISPNYAKTIVNHHLSSLDVLCSSQKEAHARPSTMLLSPQNFSPFYPGGQQSYQMQPNEHLMMQQHSGLFDLDQHCHQSMKQERIQIHHPTEFPTIHHQSALSLSDSHRASQKKGSTVLSSPLQQGIEVLLPEALQPAASDFQSINKLQSSDVALSLLPTYPLQSEEEQDPDCHQILAPIHSRQQSSAGKQHSHIFDLPLLEGTPLAQHDDSNDRSVSSFFSTPSSSFMDKLDAKIESASETLVALVRDADAATAKVDTTTAWSVEIASTICTKLLVDEVEELSLDYSEQDRAGIIAVADEDHVQINHRALTLKRKACDINLDGDTDSDPGQSIRSSLREYDNLMSRKVHSAPENKKLGKPKFPRIMDREIVRKLFNDQV